MKVVIMAAMMLTTASTAYADSRQCRVYEYAEMKDMTDAELQSEIEITIKREMQEMDYGNNMAELSAYKRADEHYAASRGCLEQSKRLWAVKTKRPGYVAPPKPTYAGCVEALTAAGVDISACSGIPK